MNEIKKIIERKMTIALSISEIFLPLKILMYRKISFIRRNKYIQKENTEKSFIE